MRDRKKQNKIADMILKTKEDVCLYITKDLQSFYKKIGKTEGTYGKVEIPIYKSKWKKKILSIFQRLFFQRAYGQLEEVYKVSRIDFSKFIPADEWRTYEVTNKSKLALPKLLIEHEFCWEARIVHEFFKEDLQYGVRPIEIYNRIIELGGGPILLDKKNGQIYRLGSGVGSKYIEDFSLYKKGKDSKLDWSEPPNVKFR